MTRSSVPFDAQFWTGYVHAPVGGADLQPPVHLGRALDEEEEKALLQRNTRLVFIKPKENEMQLPSNEPTIATPDPDTVLDPKCFNDISQPSTQPSTPGRGGGSCKKAEEVQQRHQRTPLRATLALVEERRKAHLERRLQREQDELKRTMPTFKPNINSASREVFEASWGSRPPPVQDRLYALAKCKKHESQQLALLIESAAGQSHSTSLAHPPHKQLSNSRPPRPLKTNSAVAVQANKTNSDRLSGPSLVSRYYNQSRTFEDLLLKAKEVADRRRQFVKTSRTVEPNTSSTIKKLPTFTPEINPTSRAQARGRTLNDLLNNAEKRALRLKTQTLNEMSERAVDYWSQTRRRRMSASRGPCRLPEEEQKKLQERRGSGVDRKENRHETHCQKESYIQKRAAEELQECTFSPHIEAYPRLLLKEREARRHSVPDIPESSITSIQRHLFRIAHGQALKLTNATTPSENSY